MWLHNSDELIILASHTAGIESSFNLNRVMPIIINDGDTANMTFQIKAATYPFELGEGLANNLNINAHFKGNSNRGETVLDIMCAKHRERHIRQRKGLAHHTIR